MSKHTPGPWEVFPFKGDGKRIAIFGNQKWYPGKAFCWVDHDDVDHEEMEANARLIAAAPEMLEACNAIRDDLQSGSYGPINEPLSKISVRAYLLLYAAITKATGESSE